MCSAVFIAGRIIRWTYAVSFPPLPFPLFSLHYSHYTSPVHQFCCLYISFPPQFDYFHRKCFTSSPETLLYLILIYLSLDLVQFSKLSLLLHYLFSLFGLSYPRNSLCFRDVDVVSVLFSVDSYIVESLFDWISSSPRSSLLFVFFCFSFVFHCCNLKWHRNFVQLIHKNNR